MTPSSLHSGVMQMPLAVLRKLFLPILVISCRKSTTTISQLSHLDKMFNDVVYGIKVCPKGTPKHAQLQSNLSHLVPVFLEDDTCIG